MSILTLESITPLRCWEELPWLGLCTHSSLLEITFADLTDDMPNLDEFRLAEKERLRLNSQKYKSENQAAPTETVPNRFNDEVIGTYIQKLDESLNALKEVEYKLYQEEIRRRVKLRLKIIKMH